MSERATIRGGAARARGDRGRGGGGRGGAPAGGERRVTLRLRSHSFPDEAKLMMAIVNRTPDSFYDKGATWAEDKAFERVATVVAQVRICEAD